MAVYGLKYECTFDPVGPVVATPVYKIEIREKDYFGDPSTIIASAVPVLHQWQTDDPKAPIKGSSLSISLINNGSLPLESFYSTEDDHFKVRFYWGLQLMFEGFLVQDDCSETMVDFTHEINLSANDNLGLLKDVSFGEMLQRSIAVRHDVTILSSGFNIDMPLTLLVGDQFEIHDATTNYGTYTVLTVVDADSYTTTSTMPFLSGVYTIILQEPVLAFDLITILKVVQLCLLATDLELNTNIFCNFKEASQDLSKLFMEEIKLNSQTFLKDDTDYDNCYGVLEKVLARFNCTLFQSKGSWNIVHWDELRYYGYPVPGFTYDSDFNLLGAAKLNSESIIFGGYDMFQIGIGELSKAETGILHKILRPFQFDKETFNYKQPARLLRNFDLQETGDLLNTYTTGSGATLHTINEYEATWWDPSTRLDAGSGTYFIRVTLDNLGNEIERVLVVTKDTKSYKIEVSQGDAFRYSFSFKTEDSQAGNINLTMYVELYDGTTTNYYHEDGTWTTSVGYVYNIPSGDNSNVWHTVTIDSSSFPVPYDGVLYCYLRIMDLAGTINETYYKDIRFEYFSTINQSTKIIGHTHKTQQTAVIKQNQEREIFLDDSPRNSIAGTLYLPTLTGLLQDRTVGWFLNDSGDVRKLGNYTTFETMLWRHIVRSILEGTYYGLISPALAGDHVSMLSVFNYTFFPGLNFVAGTMEIDYRNNKFSGTLWELCTDTETDADITSTYEFKYLYSTK